jgi:quercetin dioxygenase-like cupin family protein
MTEPGVVRGNDIPVEETPWGSLQWLVGGRSHPEAGVTIGRVTFKPGQANPAHRHPNCEEILFVVAGEVEHTLPGGGKAVLHPGDAIVMHRGEKHQARNIGKETAVVLVAFNSPQRETLGE